MPSPGTGKPLFLCGFSPDSPEARLPQDDARIIDDKKIPWKESLQKVLKMAVLYLPALSLENQQS
jgi:hypothetical protein